MQENASAHQLHVEVTLPDSSTCDLANQCERPGDKRIYKAESARFLTDAFRFAANLLVVQTCRPGRMRCDAVHKPAAAVQAGASVTRD